MPIFDQIRARGEVGNAYPLHVGSTAGPTLHMAHVNPNTCYWVIHRFYYIIYLLFQCFVVSLLYTPRCGLLSQILVFFSGRRYFILNTLFYRKIFFQYMNNNENRINLKMCDSIRLIKHLANILLLFYVQYSLDSTAFTKLYFLKGSFFYYFI